MEFKFSVGTKIIEIDGGGELMGGGVHMSETRISRTKKWVEKATRKGHKQPIQPHVFPYKNLLTNLVPFITPHANLPPQSRFPTILCHLSFPSFFFFDNNPSIIIPTSSNIPPFQNC